MSKEQAAPTGWQEEKSPFGGVRRFRMMGNIKEYEETITTSFGTVTRSQLEDMQKGEKERKPECKNLEEKLKKNCPFRNGINSRCIDNCAMYSPDGCTLIRSFEGKAHRETAGKYCPISSRSCGDMCEFYNNGCVLAAE